MSRISTAGIKSFVGEYLTIPLDIVPWFESSNGEMNYALDIRTIPKPWEPIVCTVRGIVTDPSTFDIEVDLFGFGVDFQYDPDVSSIDVELPWGYLGLVPEGPSQLTFFSVRLRNRYTGIAVQYDHHRCYLINGDIPLVDRSSAAGRLLEGLRTDRERVRHPRREGRHAGAGRRPTPQRRTRPVRGAPRIGEPGGGGFFFGITSENGVLYKNYVAPRQYEMAGAICDDLDEMDPNHPLRKILHRTDSRANTEALQPYSTIAKAICGLTIDGFSDWGIPALDVGELLYRNLNSGERWIEHTYDKADGDNASSVPQGFPYAPHQPPITEANAFRHFGPQAFHWAMYCWLSNPAVPDAEQLMGVTTAFGGSPRYLLNTWMRLSVRPVRREPLIVPPWATW